MIEKLIADNTAAVIAQTEALNRNSGLLEQLLKQGERVVTTTAPAPAETPKTGGRKATSKPKAEEPAPVVEPEPVVEETPAPAAEPEEDELPEPEDLVNPAKKVDPEALRTEIRTLYRDGMAEITEAHKKATDDAEKSELAKKFKDRKEFYFAAVGALGKKEDGAPSIPHVPDADLPGLLETVKNLFA